MIMPFEAGIVRLCTADGSIVGAGFLVTDRYVLTCAQSGLTDCTQSEIILWDVATRQPLGSPLAGHRGSARSLAFSPDGSLLASGGGDSAIILWDASLERWQARACRRANRNLTRAEWQQYLGDEPYHPTCPNLPVPEE